MSDLETHNQLEAATGLRHQRPLWIWDRDNARFVWANGAGIEFWGAAGLGALQAMRLNELQPVFDRVSEAINGLAIGEEVKIALRVPHGGHSRDYRACCRAGQLQGRGVMIVELMRPVARRAAAFGADPEIQAPPLNGAAALEVADKALNADEPPRLPDEEKPDGATGGEPNAQTINKRADDSPSADQTTGISAGKSEGPLTELARLIEAAQQGREDGAETATPHSEAEAKNKSQNEALKGPQKQPLASAASEAFEALDLDFTALKGAGSDDEINAILANCPLPLALLHVPRILHANEMFVSDFGYGDITSLGNDGTDWIFPQSREVLQGYLQSSMQEPLVISSARLCSGRVMQRPLYLTPLRLTRYNRTVLLCVSGNGFAGGTEGEKGTAEGALLEALNDVPLLSLISHEVRTPLNVISGFAEMMTREAFGPLGHKKYAEYANDIHLSAAHALSFVNDMLDLSKLNAGHWVLEAKPVQLNEIVREQVHLMRGLAAERGVKLRSLLEENLPQVMVDERVLVQILINLVGNGLKFNQPGGLVTVVTELREGGSLVLSVEDTGVGMSAGELERAVHPFQQFDRGVQQAGDGAENGREDGSVNGTEKAAEKGTGLGLAIVKALAKASKIGFSLTSTTNQGTRASLIFPARP